MDFPIITEAIETIKKGQKINPKEGFSIIVKITKVVRLATCGMLLMEPFATTFSNSKIY